MSVALPYQTALGVLISGCLRPGFLSGVRPLEQVGSQKWSCEELVNEQSPAPSTHRASLWVRDELFSWWDSQFQLAPGFSKTLHCPVAFPMVVAKSLHPPTCCFSSALCPSPPGRGDIFPPCISSPVLFKGGAISSPAVLEHEVPSQCVVLTWWVCRFTWLKMDQLQGSAGRWQTEVLCPLCLAGPSLPWCMLLCLCSSLCCIIVDKVADTVRRREICACRQQ
jgi:hypothetical protein